MDTIMLFKKAAAAMQEDERYLKLEAARKANDENEELQRRIDVFNRARLALNAEMQNENQDHGRVGKMKEELNKHYSDIMADDNMQAYNEANENISGLLNHINAIITAAVNGEDPMLVDEPAKNCGHDGCSSCSGCG